MGESLRAPGRFAGGRIKVALDTADYTRMTRVRLGYRVMLLVVVVAAAAYVVIGQVRSAHHRAQAKKAAAVAAVWAREDTALRAKAGRLIASLPAPRSLTPQQAVYFCSDDSPTQLCFSSSAPPSRAIRPAIASVSSVVTVKRPTCGVPANLGRVYGKAWQPCNAHAVTVTDSDGDVFITVTAFPTEDAAHSHRGHIAYSGSRVEIDAETFAAGS